MTTDKQAQRTPGPWRYSGQGKVTSCDLRANPFVVAHMPERYTKGIDAGQIDANAAFIVRACNSHDDLIAALRDCCIALEAFRARPIPPEMRESGVDRAIRNARAAIAKAEA